MKANLKNRIKKLEAVSDEGVKACVIWPNDDGTWYTYPDDSERITFQTLEKVEAYAEQFQYSLLVEWVD